MKNIIQKVNLDAMGITASVACAVHCAVLPLFFSSLPVFGFEILHEKLFEYGMITLAATIGCITLYHGYKKHHHRLLPLLVFACGFLFLLLKEVFNSIELILLIPAAVLIISAHILNFRLCRKINRRYTVNCNHAEFS